MAEIVKEREYVAGGRRIVAFRAKTKEKRKLEILAAAWGVTQSDVIRVLLDRVDLAQALAEVDGQNGTS